MQQKPKLSFWQIWNMSFGFLGIQFGYALQGGFMSRIFETLGADEHSLPLLWIAAPLTGLIVQPIIGQMSDNTWHPRYGRRRPYFLIGAILASITLLFVPHSSALWMAAGGLWILDATMNISMEPFRALVADKLPDSQRSFGFVVQTLIIGVSTWVASKLPDILTYFGVSNEADPGVVPMSVQLAFGIGAGVFLLAILYTVFTTKEYPPEDIEAFRAEQKANSGLRNTISEVFKNIMNMPRTMLRLGVVQFFSWFAFFCMWSMANPALTDHIYDSAKPKLDSLEEHLGEQFTELSLSEKSKAFSSMERLALLSELKNQKIYLPVSGFKSLLQKRKEPKLFYAGDDAIGMPLDALPESTIKSIRSYTDKKQEEDHANVEGAPLIHRGNFNDTLEKYIKKDLLVLEGFKLRSDYEKSKEFVEAEVFTYRKKDKSYNDASNKVGSYMGKHGLSSMLFALLLTFWTAKRRINRKYVHMISLFIGAFGFISMYSITEPSMLIVSFICIGFSWGSILSMPYAMLSSTLDPNKMGVYMGIFNIFIVIPQIVAATSLTVIYKSLFGAEPINAMLLAGLSLVIAGLANLLITNRHAVTYTPSE